MPIKTFNTIKQEMGIGPRDLRPSAASRGYDRKWRRARYRFLQKNPLCIECRKKGLIVTATVVDHIEPHKGDQVKFWNERNWQPMCKFHHDVKTGEGN